MRHRPRLRHLPGRTSPASASAWDTHRRSVCAFIPDRPAIPTTRSRSRRRVGGPAAPSWSWCSRRTLIAIAHPAVEERRTKPRMVQCEQLAAPMGSATNSRSDASPLEPNLVKERPSGTAPLQSPATCTGTPATTPRVPQSTASRDGSGSKRYPGWSCSLGADFSTPLYYFQIRQHGDGQLEGHRRACPSLSTSPMSSSGTRLTNEFR